jgi:hypothetical protein
MQASQRTLSAFPRELSPIETQLLRQLVVVQGRDPWGFSAAVLPDGTISVRSPAAAAFYPLDGWTSRFMRHLHQGYFDAQTLRRAVQRVS